MSRASGSRRHQQWIEEQLEALAGLRNASSRDPSFKAWRQSTLTVLQRIWGSEPARSERFRRIPFTPSQTRADGRTQRDWFGRGCAEATTYLRELLEELEHGAAPGERTASPAGAPRAGAAEDDFPVLELPEGAESPERRAPAPDDSVLDLGGPSGVAVPGEEPRTPEAEGGQGPPTLRIDMHAARQAMRDELDRPRVQGPPPIPPQHVEATPAEAAAPPSTPPAVEREQFAASGPPRDIEVPPAGFELLSPLHEVMPPGVEWKPDAEALPRADFELRSAASEVMPELPRPELTLVPPPGQATPAESKPPEAAARAKPKATRAKGRKPAPRERLKDMLGLDALEVAAAAEAISAEPEQPAPPREPAPPEARTPGRERGVVTSTPRPLRNRPRQMESLEGLLGGLPGPAAPQAAPAPGAREASATQAGEAPSAATPADARAGRPAGPGEGPAAPKAGAPAPPAPEEPQPSLDPEEFASAAEDFLRTSPVLALQGSPVQRRGEDTGHDEPDAVAVASLAGEVARLGVPEGFRAAARAQLLSLAQALEKGALDWMALRDIVLYVMEYPALARRLLPILLPWFDRAA